MKTLYTALASVLLPMSAQAVDIQQLETPSGLQFWLVESHSIPFVSAQMAFRAGTAFEASTQQGTASLTASMLTEGTKQLDADAYKETLEELGSGITAAVDRLNLVVSMQTLSENTDNTFKLFADTAFAPRFAPTDFERLQTQTLAAIKRRAENPSAVAGDAFKEALYPNHPYSHTTLGDEAVVSSLKPKALRSYQKAYLTCDNMALSMVGDISPEKAVSLVEKTIVPYCASTAFNRKAITDEPVAPTPSLVRISKPVPQSTILVGHKGISRQDKDYFASYVMNYILGGGGFNSRLMEEIREKRGLAYGAYSYFDYAPLAGGFIASVSTKNKDADKVVKLVHAELKRMKEQGATQAEFDGAIQYLTGSFPLRLDSNEKILGYLTVMQMENLGVDYVATWQDKVRKVTLADVNRVAKRLLQPENTVTVIVGGK